MTNFKMDLPLSFLYLISTVRYRDDIFPAHKVSKAWWQNMARTKKVKTVMVGKTRFVPSAELDRLSDFFPHATNRVSGMEAKVEWSNIF